MRSALLTIIITLFLSLSVNSYALDKNTLDKRLDRTATSFENVLNSNNGPIPPAILARAQGILIFRQFGAGFWLGGKGGYGVVMARRNDGHWSNPAFVKSVEASLGPQIGIQQIDLVILFMNVDSMRVFDGGKFRIGVDASAAVGPVGAGAEAKVGAPILVYGSTGGLYIGAKFEGGMMIPDRSANSTMYDDPGISVPEVIYQHRHSFPRSAARLVNTLEDYEAKAKPQGGWGSGWWNPTRPNGSAIPNGSGRL